MPPRSKGRGFSMTKRSPCIGLRRALACLAMALWCPLLASANPTPGDGRPLASKEEMIRDRFQRFQDRVFRLREQLAQAEPDNAARLGRALTRSGELALSEKLDEIIRQLKDGAQLDQAADAQAAWIEEADRLLGILLEQDANNDERKKEMERLQQYQEKLSQILSQQKGLRSDSAQSTEAQRMGKQLDQAIARAEALLRKQQQLSQQAPSTPTAEEQKALSRETEQLAEDLKNLAESPSSESTQPSAVDQAKQQTQAASQATQSASSSMSQAGQQMSQAGSPSPQDAQKQAEKSLQEAKKQLEEAKKALAESQQPNAQQSGEQRQVAQQTKGMGDQMKQDASSSQSGQKGQQGGQQGKSGKSGKKTPGAENLDQAESDMNGAAESLDEQKPQDATPKQDDAITQLEQAQQELEQAIEQLRKEQREETLRDLEARFREMLTKQRPINDATLSLDRAGKESFGRAEELQLAELSTNQRALSEQAATCLHILDEEGSTIAFPQVVEQLSEDMASSADRLAGSDVGTVTQAIQQEIVDTLEQLLDAVKKMQQENEQQQSQQGQQANKDPPLLPASAELKLLRSSQVRINSRTTAITDGAAKGTESRDAAAKGLKKLAARQAECAEIAKQMREKELSQ